MKLLILQPGLLFFRGQAMPIASLYRSKLVIQTTCWSSCSKIGNKLCSSEVLLNWLSTKTVI